MPFRLVRQIAIAFGGVVCPAMAGRRGYMFVVYILQNSISHKRYIGSTGNLLRRLEEHNRGQTKSTKQMGTWKLIYKEEFHLRNEALSREHILKSYKGGNALKILLRV